jgi:hypothetical protein
MPGFFALANNRISIMKNDAFLDPAEEEIFASNVSDEALEAAAEPEAPGVYTPNLLCGLTQNPACH